MKTTIFTWEFPPNIYGGAGVHAKYIATSLAKLIDVEVRTLEEIGKELKLSRERVRQIEARALEKLRHPSRNRRLRGFLEN